MIERDVWPSRADRTILGPWYSWRDSFLNWPNPDPKTPTGFLSLMSGGVEFDGKQFPSRSAAVPKTWTLKVGAATQTVKLDDANLTLEALVDAVDGKNAGVWATLVGTGDHTNPIALQLTALPPVFEPNTRSSWRCHPFFRDLLYRIASKTDGDAQSTYILEMGGSPARGDNKSLDAPDSSPQGGGEKVNRYPTGSSIDAKDDPTGIAGFLKANGAEADPHAWGILQRMGLAVNFRVRFRKTGKYVERFELADLVREHLAGVFANHPYPSITAMKPHLEIEFLFQPGQKNRLAHDERNGHGDDATFDMLLAQARLSLRPTVTQRYRYEAHTISGNDTTKKTTIVPGGSLFDLIVASDSGDVDFLIETGTPGEPVNVPGGTSTVLKIVMPPSEKVTVLLRGRDLSHATVSGQITVTTTTTSTSTTVPLPATKSSFRPIDWRSTFMTVPDDAPWVKDNDDPLPPGTTVDPETQSPNTGWRRLGLYLKNIQAGMPTLKDVDSNPHWGDDVRADKSLHSQFLGWLNRFFIEGGDVTAPGDDGPTPIPAGGKLAHTGAGPWIASAYPRGTTPMTLAPDAAGRITYFQMIEDLWGHIHRYYLRPQGRYDLIWAALSRSRKIFQKAATFGLVERLQRQVGIPKPGGMDVVMERIRPLAAPLVLSSRRLDAPAPAGNTVPPGAIWEVLIVRHHEQELIERNRALADRLGFRQVAHALVRTFAHADMIDALRPLAAQALSGPFSSSGSSPKIGVLKFHLVSGAVNTTFTTTATDTLDDLSNTVGHLLGTMAGVSVLKTTVAPSSLAVLRLAIKPTGTVKPRLAVVDASGETNFMSELLDLSAGRFQTPVNSGDASVPSGLAPPRLPGPLAKLDHLELDALSDDEALSIDLPIRCDRFTLGLTALQWTALPFYYTHRLMLVAQASAVSSPITTVDQRDFSYVTPPPIAVMEGIGFGDGPRRRRIVISLARLWDCLPVDAQARWPVEDPNSVLVTDSQSKDFRHSAMPDRDVVYQVIVGWPSGNVEVLAEYRFPSPSEKPVDTVGYESRPIPSPYRGDVVRLLPPEDKAGVGAQFFRLETLLTDAAGAEPNAVVTEPISGRARFQTAADLGIVKLVPQKETRVCALRLPSGPVDDAVGSAILTLASTTDPSFASALSSLLSTEGPERYAEACIGLEQLTEINPDVRLDVGSSGTPRTLMWVGPATADQIDAIKTWATRSLFANALNALAAALDDGVVKESFPSGDPNNPTAADVAPIPTSRLEVSADGFVWHDLFKSPALSSETGVLTTLRSKPGLPAAVGTAIDSLLAVLTSPSKAVIDLVRTEPSWRPRPTPGTLPAALAPVLLIGHGLMAFEGMMSRDEGVSLLGAAGASKPDRQAIIRLFDASLNGGLGGGKLELMTRRGAAGTQTAPITASIGP
jgi:hypothetical protein